MDRIRRLIQRPVLIRNDHSGSIGLIFSIVRISIDFP